MRFAGTRRSPAMVDVTPLIDIIFQLVLFFMVSTTFVTSPGIEVDLPRSSSSTILRDRHDVKVWMTADGRVLVDDEPTSWQGLERIFAKAGSEDASTLVIIKADKAVEHGRVVAVMDLARRHGLTRLAIATEARPAAGSDDR